MIKTKRVTVGTTPVKLAPDEMPAGSHILDTPGRTSEFKASVLVEVRATVGGDKAIFVSQKMVGVFDDEDFPTQGFEIPEGRPISLDINLGEEVWAYAAADTEVQVLQYV